MMLGISPKLFGMGIIMLELGCSFRKYIDCHDFTLPFPRKIRDFTEKSRKKHIFSDNCFGCTNFKINLKIYITISVPKMAKDH